MPSPSFASSLRFCESAPLLRFRFSCSLDRPYGCRTCVCATACAVHLLEVRPFLNLSAEVFVPMAFRCLQTCHFSGPPKVLRYSLEYCCWPFTLVLGVLRLECHRRRRAFTLVLEPGPALSSITATLAWLHRSLPFVCADPVFLVSFTAASSLTPLLILKP